MKTIFILLLFFCNSLQAQTASIKQSLGNPADITTFQNNKLEDFKGIDIIDNSIEPDSLIITGQAPNERLGYSVSTAGDVNGDGYSDAIVAYENGNSIKIYFGNQDLNNIQYITLTGTYNFGTSATSAGDVNGDGYSDVIVGGYGYSENQGRAYIFFGGAIMDNVADVILTGEAVSLFGYSVSTAGDVNGDGYSDVIVGAHGFNDYKGRVYIYYGGINMDNVADVILKGQIVNIAFGLIVSTAGDVNGDGFSDVIVGDYAYITDSLHAYIYFGSISVDSIPDVNITYNAVTNGVGGCSIACAGDVNRDGFSDIIIGAREIDSARGKAYVYYGGIYMDNTIDVVFNGENTRNYFGSSVSSIGDLNGDGFSDVIIGAFGFNNTGRVYVYYGSSNMNNIVDIKITGEATNNYYGCSVSSAGDFNGDSFSDIIVGAWGYQNNTGRAYLYKNLGSKIYLKLNNPLNNSINNPLSINFKWNKLNNISYYILNVSTDSLFYNVIIKDTIFIDTLKTVNGFQKDSKYYWKVIAKDTLGSQYSSTVWSFNTEPTIKISLKILMEGMYYPLFNIMSRKDTVKVYLHQITSPYNIIDSSKSVIDSLTFRGIFKFYNVAPGTYFLSFKHLNSIETWSKSGGVQMTLTDTAFYDFTTSISQAYGNNLKLKGGKYCIYGGNVNGDAIVDGGDLSEADNDSFTGLTGRFLRSDVNGDNIVDAADVSLVDNNSFNSIVRITP